MSIILDALKKSESDQQRQSGPALFEVRVAPPRPRLPAWAIAIAALLVINLSIVGYMLLRHSSRSDDTRASNTSNPAATPAGGPYTASGQGTGPMGQRTPQQGGPNWQANTNRGGNWQGAQGERNGPGGFNNGPGGPGGNANWPGQGGGNGSQGGGNGPQQGGNPNWQGQGGPNWSPAQGAAGGPDASGGQYPSDGPRGQYPSGAAGGGPYGAADGGPYNASNGPGANGSGPYGAQGNSGAANAASNRFGAPNVGGQPNGGPDEPTLMNRARQAAAENAPAANPDDYAPATESDNSLFKGHVKRGTESGVPLYQDMAVVPGANLPQLRLDLHVYAAKPEERFALINMRKMHEGDALADGVRVEAITPDGVIMSKNGSKFLLPRE